MCVCAWGGRGFIICGSWKGIFFKHSMVGVLEGIWSDGGVRSGVVRCGSETALSCMLQTYDLVIGSECKYLSVIPSKHRYFIMIQYSTFENGHHDCFQNLVFVRA